MKSATTAAKALYILPPMQQSHAARSVWKTIAYMFRYMRDGKKLYILGVALMLVDAICQMLVPLAFGAVINALEADAAHFLNQQLWPSIGLATALIIVFAAVAYLGHTSVLYALSRLARNARVELFQHIQSLSANFFQRHRVGEISSRLNQDLERVEVGFRMGMGIIWSFAALILAAVMMALINPLMAALCLALQLFATLITNRAMPAMRNLSRAQRNALGHTSAIISEYMSLNPLIKSYTREDQAAERVAALSQNVYQQTSRLVRWQYCFNDGMQVLMKFIAPFALLLIGAVLIAGDSLRIGDLIAIWGYWMALSATVAGILNALTEIMGGVAAADRMIEFFDETPLVDDAEHAQDLTISNGSICFDAVRFHYPMSSDEAVLKGMDLHIRAGERLALVGPSGAGKSTIIQLLLRFYDPRCGAIRIDEQDIREVKQADLRRHIGVVFQDSHFIAGSIADNLRLGKLNATEAEMWQALEAAHAADFVRELPQELHAQLGEQGARLSGGQRQRLSIARVFLKNPPIVCFDEATSALDPDSEAAVQQAMNQLLRGRTAIIVAHRIATIRDADRIAVIENGQVSAIGPHDELLMQSERYRRFCSQQRVA